VVAEVPDAAFAAGGRAATLIRVEGFAPSVAYRSEKLKAQLQALGDIVVFEEEASEAVWREVRDVAVFGSAANPIWRISVAPSAGPRMVAALRDLHAFRHFYDWSGGLVWIEAETEAADGLAREIRIAVAAAGGGHATLVRGSAVLRNAVSPFEPQPDALAALTRRLKEQFDPRGILNPGRMVAGG
jgi:glycolate oxidase FAD binding subunit